jgi:inorganic pyrophosphatase
LHDDLAAGFLGDQAGLSTASQNVRLRSCHVAEYTALPEITREQIQHFFEHYKDLEPGKWVKTIGWGNRADALLTIQQSIERAR